MLVKSVILGGKDSLAHDERHFLDFNQGAPLFAKLTDQRTFGRVNAKWNLRPVICQDVQ